MKETVDKKSCGSSKKLNGLTSHYSLKSGGNAGSGIDSGGNAVRSNVYLGLGSNMGDREKTLIDAIGMLGDMNNTEVAAVSPFYATSPWGYAEQPDFLNCAVLIHTSLSPHAVLEACMDIERRLGRVRAVRWGPRVIDLDILFYDNLVLKDEKLEIPHPLLHEREFVLLPLKDIAPDFVHPVFGVTISRLYEKFCGK